MGFSTEKGFNRIPLTERFNSEDILYKDLDLYNIGGGAFLSVTVQSVSCIRYRMSKSRGARAKNPIVAGNFKWIFV